MYYVYVKYLMIMTFPKKTHETVYIRNLLTNTKKKKKKKKTNDKVIAIKQPNVRKRVDS